MTGIAMQDESALEATVRRAADGDEMASVRLVSEHYAPMVRAAYAVTCDPELAREATQLAWTKAWRRLGSLREPDRVRPWLVAIAANEARQLVRGHHRRTIHEISVGTDDRTGGDPSGRIIEAIDLKRALLQLTPDDKGLLALRFAAGLDSNQIGEQTGMSASGVRSRLARLLERLRRDLDDA